uniref:Glutathione S-transferase 1 n=1 Tax=Syphacia muris TaxID=451379 RepID=A0A0N5AYE0_9BILA
MTKYKLTYFNAMGRAELMRMMFALKGVEYEDVRISKEDWPNMKPTTPFGQLPLLEVDGKVLAQSVAIAIYLANKLGLNGANDWEAAKIHEIFGATEDLFNAVIPAFKCEDPETKKKLIAEFEKDHLDLYFQRIGKMLVANGTGYIVGKQISVADLLLANIAGLFGHMCQNTMAKHPDLTKFKEKIFAIPQIKKWIETRPKTDM